MALTHFTVQAPAPGYNGFASGAVVTADGVFREHFPRGGIAVATGETPPVGIVPAETPFKIINGVLCDASGSPGVRLKCDQAALGLSTALQYEASFHNVDVSGKPSSIAGFTFNAQPTDTPLNLLTVTPVAAAAAVAAAGLLSTQITDSTAVGRSVLTATDAPTARTALGISGSGAEWESYINFAAFPVTGNAALEYVAQDTGKLYRWNSGTSAYVQIADKAAVGLGNVDNTADLNKPLSVPQGGAVIRKALQLEGDNRDGLLKAGLYMWHDQLDRPALQPQLEWLGLKYVRMGGYPSDALMTWFANHNCEVMWTCDPGVFSQGRATFSTDAAFIAAHLAQLDTYLNQYGPRGTFWANNQKLHYCPITQVEIMNEPNFYFPGTMASITALYAQVLVAAYDHIKANWPDITVVGFAGGNASSNAVPFTSGVLDNLVTLGRLDCFDVWSVHPYAQGLNTSGIKVTGPPEQLITESWGTWYPDTSLANIQQKMLQHGIDKPCWFTEQGWYISNADGGFYSPTAGMVTLTQQAAYTIRMQMMAIRHGVQRTYAMNIIDTDGYNGGWFDTANSPRMVATAMKSFMRLMAGATNLEVLADGGSAPATNPYIYRVTTPRGRVTVAWCQTAGTFSIPLDADSPIQVSDMVGNPIATVSGGTYSAALSEVPIYLYPVPVLAGAASTAVKLATARNINGVPFDGTADVTVADSTKQPVLTVTSVKTSAYTAAAGDIIPADTTSAGFTITLPTTPADRARVVIKKMDSASNAVTVATAGPDVFNTTAGPVSFGLSLQNQAVQLQYFAGPAIWYVISTDVPLSGLDARYQQAGSYTAKGDILAATGAGAPVRVAVGADSTVLTANSASANGVSWTAVSFSSAVDNHDGTITYSGSATNNGDGTITIN